MYNLLKWGFGVLGFWGFGVLGFYEKIVNESGKEIIKKVFRIKECDGIEDVFVVGDIIGLANHTLLIAKNGQESPISDSGSPIRDSAGKITGVVLVFRDVTQEYRIQLEQKRNSETIKHLNETLQELLSDRTQKLEEEIKAHAKTEKSWIESEDRFRVAQDISLEAFTIMLLQQIPWQEIYILMLPQKKWHHLLQ